MTDEDDILDSDLIEHEVEPFETEEEEEESY